MDKCMVWYDVHSNCYNNKLNNTCCNSNYNKKNNYIINANNNNNNVINYQRYKNNTETNYNKSNSEYTNTGYDNSTGRLKSFGEFQVRPDHSNSCAKILNPKCVRFKQETLENSKESIGQTISRSYSDMKIGKNSVHANVMQGSASWYDEHKKSRYKRSDTKFKERNYYGGYDGGLYIDGDSKVRGSDMHSENAFNNDYGGYDIISNNDLNFQKNKQLFMQNNSKRVREMRLIRRTRSLSVMAFASQLRSVKAGQL